MDSDEYDYGNDNCQKDPPAQLNALFKISNTSCHRSTIELARLPPCSALPIAPLPSISEIPFPRFTNVDSPSTIRAPSTNCVSPFENLPAVAMAEWKP